MDHTVLQGEVYMDINKRRYLLHGSGIAVISEYAYGLRVTALQNFAITVKIIEYQSNVGKRKLHNKIV